MKPITLTVKRYWYTNILIYIVSLLGCIPVVKYTATSGDKAKVTKLTLNQLAGKELNIEEIIP